MQFAAFPGAGISIHALREEGDASASSTSTAPPNFYPRPPRGGRPRQRDQGRGKGRISIHALREEGDFFWTTRPISSQYFYPRPPRGGRLRILNNFNNVELFLSTPSARRATLCRSPSTALLLISIHALREEGDFRAASSTTLKSNFYPRPPRGGRPSTPPPWSSVAHFYPRPPRGGRLFFFSISVLHVDFYPRPPRGGRRAGQRQRAKKDEFLSTPSARRATVGNSQSGGHAQLFLSTPSARRATRAATGVKADILFLSTPSARRATYAPCIFRPCRRFLSTPSARRATIVQQQGGWGKLFLSTPSARRATSL